MPKSKSPGKIARSIALPIKVWAPGLPKGQPRGRAFVTGGEGAKPKARIFTPGTAEAWKGDIARAFERYLSRTPLAGPLELVADIHFKRPKRLLRKKDPDHPLPCDGLPDWDNAGKAISDALEHLGVIANDKSIVFATVRKWYAGRDRPPGALIRLFAVGDDAWRALFGALPATPEALPFGSTAFSIAVQDLMKRGYAAIGYTDPRKRDRRLYANAKNVRDGKRDPWASIGPGGDVTLYQEDPRPTGYRSPGGTGGIRDRLARRRR